MSFSVTSLLFFAGPVVTLLIASAMSFSVISLLFALATNIAASFSMFSISAPENPAVSLANFLKSTFPSIALFLACSLIIASLPLTSGKLIYTCLSKRPGLNNAGSRTSALLVAAITMMFVFESNPSIFTSN